MAPVERPGPLVEVEWMDITTSAGWQDPDDLAALVSGDPGVRVVTVGYLLVEKPDRIVVCSTANAVGDVSEITVIPRGAVTRINRLGPKRRG